MEAEAKAYGMTTLMEALQGVDPKVIQALATVGMDAGRLVV